MIYTVNTWCYSGLCVNQGGDNYLDVRNVIYYLTFLQPRILLMITYIYTRSL